MNTILAIVLISSIDLNFDHNRNFDNNEKPRIELLEDPNLKENALLPLPKISEEPFENELLPLPDKTPIPDLLEEQN
ncbi:hypothetical protein [Alkalibacillus silvisoli]